MRLARLRAVRFRHEDPVSTLRYTLDSLLLNECLFSYSCPSYYVLVVTCVLARRKEWLRNACLAAALLLPAVAAIHAVVLAAVQ